MPFKDLTKRSEYQRLWRKLNPNKWRKYYRASLLKKATPARKRYLEKKWAKKDLA